MIRRWLYAAAAGLFGLLFFFLLARPLKELVPEVDLWWMMPAFSYHLEGRTGWSLVLYLLGPSPSLFAFPSHKVILWLLEITGLPLSAWAWATAILHAVNAGLFGWLLRKLGSSERVCWLAAISFLCIFAQFHSIVWLPASQHVLTLFSIFSTLLLFLAAERKRVEGNPYARLYGLTLISMLAASIQNAAILAALLITAYLLVEPASTPKKKADRFGRWIPVLFASCIYPCVAHSFSYVKPLISVVAEVQAPPILKASVLLGLGAGALLLIWLFLRWMASHPAAGKRGALVILVFMAAAIPLFLALRDSRQWLIVYNGIVPMAAVLSSFLDPLGTAMKMDPAMRYYYIPAGLSGWNLFLTVLLFLFFAWAILRHKKQFFLLGIWYITILLYLLLHRHVASSMPFYTQSRYEMYITPIFCLLFCSAVLFFYSKVTRLLKFRGIGREVVLLGLFALFWLPNLLAIRVALLRGQLGNSFYVYDDIRALSAIEKDLESQPAASKPKLNVQGVTPLSFKRKWNWPVPPEKVEYRLFQRLAHDRLRISASQLTLNQPPEPGERVYRLEEGRILGPQGPMESFVIDFEAGRAAMAAGDLAQALSHFENAAHTRPFFINYLVTPSGRLSDLQYLIQAGDLEDWVNRLGRREKLWSIASVSKWENVDRTIRRELFDYRQALLYSAYLRWRRGEIHESCFWLSRLRLLESDPTRLAAALRADPILSKDPQAKPFLETLENSLRKLDHLPWRKNDYGFGRWLVRVMLGKDLRSRWDAGFPEAP